MGGVLLWVLYGSLQALVGALKVFLIHPVSILIKPVKSLHVPLRIVLRQEISKWLVITRRPLFLSFAEGPLSLPCILRCFLLVGKYVWVMFLWVLCLGVFQVSRGALFIRWGGMGEYGEVPILSR